jgi:hypothetical protein
MSFGSRNFIHGCIDDGSTPEDLLYAEVQQKAWEKDKEMLFDVPIPSSVARIMMTMDCPRDCSYCVNKMKWPKDSLRIPESLKEFEHYKEVILTGGEPLLYPERVIRVATALYKQNPKVRVYLYTAMYDYRMIPILELLDGITFTVHDEDAIGDVAQVENAMIIAGATQKSNRLSIAPDIGYQMKFTPYCWRSVKIKTWKTTFDTCLVPQENLFYLGEEDDIF